MIIQWVLHGVTVVMDRGVSGGSSHADVGSMVIRGLYATCVGVWIKLLMKARMKLLYAISFWGQESVLVGDATRKWYYKWQGQGLTIYVDQWGWEKRGIIYD